jgi:hypothetical protein
VTNYFRLTPPDYTGSLKGLPGIPPPDCVLLISRSNNDFRDLQKSRQHEQTDDVSRRRIEKLIRRLLLKAGLPVFSTQQWLESHRGLYFKVKVSVSVEEPFSATVEFQLIQEVLLSRDPSIKIEAITWRYGPGTVYFRKSDWEEEELIQSRLYYLHQSNILEGVQDLVCAYRRDNQIPHRSYDGRPLKES